MPAYYNEFDPFAAQWLRNLITRGAIAPGEVDERSIEDVSPDDLVGFTQCHFFAGIGVWSYALRQAGWSDDRPVWTGSCPCQAFSLAGKGEGFADQRHLWPAFFHLISECRPPAIFGEQVEAAVKHGWLDLVQDDLEGVGYAFGAVCLPAASVGAPHIRSRLYWVGHVNRAGLEGYAGDGNGIGRPGEVGPASEAGVSSGGMVYPSSQRLKDALISHSHGELVSQAQTRLRANSHSLPSNGLVHSDSDRCREGSETAEAAGYRGTVDTAGGASGPWSDADWLTFKDGKIRPIEPGTSPMAPRTPQTVGLLRGYGNAIVAPLATEFIKSCNLAE